MPALNMYHQAHSQGHFSLSLLVHPVISFSHIKLSSKTLITVCGYIGWSGPALTTFPLKRPFCLCLHSAEGCSGVEKVLCILRHRGVQLILAYSWARPAILVAGKGIGVDVFISSVSSLSFLFLFLPCPSLFNLLYYLFCLFSPSLWETTQNDPQGKGMHKPQHNKKKPKRSADSRRAVVSFWWKIVHKQWITT